jgi:hypothetical protein
MLNRLGHCIIGITKQRRVRGSHIAVESSGSFRTYFPQLNANCGSTLVASLVWTYQYHSISQSMERVNEDQSLPRKAPRLVYPPVLEKKSPKPKPVLEYHLIEQKITSAITDFKAGKYTALLRELDIFVSGLGQLEEPPSQTESRMEANVSAPSRRLYYVNMSTV